MNFFNNNDNDDDALSGAPYPDPDLVFQALLAPKTLDENTLRWVMQSLIAAVGFWHSKVVLHRILNPIFLVLGFGLGMWLG